MAVPATLGSVAKRLTQAFHEVARDQGAPGPDGQTIEQVRTHLPVVVSQLSRSLLDGELPARRHPARVDPERRRGQRGLGVPNVVDRVVQQAVQQVLEPVYEPTFHDSSHGFRPGRSCHTAIAEAVTHVEEGYEWVVDLDLEKFFDRVNH